MPKDKPPAPKADLEMEKALISGLLLDPRSVGEIVTTLPPEGLYSDIHRLIYRAIAAMSAGGDDIDIITVAGKMRTLGTLEKIGGEAGLMEISSAVPTGAGNPFYAHKLKELYLLRQLAALGAGLQCRAQEPGELTPMEIADKTQADLVALTLANTGAVAGRLSREVVVNDMREIEALRKRGGVLPGLSTGLRALDEVLGGLQAGRLHVLAGVTGSGKSTLATNVAFHVADSRQVVAYFSLEMRGEELINRQCAAWSGVECEKIATGKILNAAVAESMTRLSDATVVIHDRMGETIESIQSRCRAYATRPGGLALAVVDYVQLIGYSRGERRANREEHIALVSRGLKMLASEMGIPVIACAQLNRESLKRDDHTPRMGDLRESNALEQDADVVAAVHRPYLFGPTEKRRIEGKMVEVPVTEHEAKLVVMKNRGGRTGIKPLHFCGAQFRFSDPSYHNESPY